MTTVRPVAGWMCAFAMLMAITACRPNRTVKLAWDAPAVMPTGYKILVDDQVVMNVPPPPVDPSCKCLTLEVPVPGGSHTLKVVAYSPAGDSPPSAIAVTK